MIVFVLYLIILLWLIHSNAFFSLFSDEHVSKRQLSVLFFFKALAVPVFYYVYKIMYGGIDKLDAGKFYHDVQAISAIAYDDLPTYLKILFGLQDDSPGNYDYVRSHLPTHNWDNGTTKDYLYNDNRVLIRVYSLLYFISFNSYFVLALFSCFFSFIGIFCLYKSFKFYFASNEMYVLVVLCLWPALWFFTGALLKEGITVMVLGCHTLFIKKAIEKRLNPGYFVFLFFFTFIACLLKPYLLLFAGLSFTLFFMLENQPKMRYKSLIFIGVMTGFLLIANTASHLLKNRSLAEAALKHQRVFEAVAKGGIYLTNDSKYVRLDYDTSLVTRVANKKDVFRINKDVSFMYWQNNNNNDTLRCEYNTDTLSQYQLVFMVDKSASNVNTSVTNKGIVGIVMWCWYYSLFHPVFFNAHGIMQVLASFENLILLIALVIIVIGFFRKSRPAFLPFTYVFVCLAVCLLVSLANPNSGAIFRYRAPVVVFVVLGALYYMPAFEQKIKSLQKRGNY